MGGNKFMDSWFGNLWRNSRKGHVVEPAKVVVGILAFEVATVMSKVVKLWECLSDRQLARLREEVVQSPGVQRLVSDDVEYVMNLVLAEIVEDLGCVAESMARFGKRCVDPLYHHLEHVIDDFVEMELNWVGWDYSLKKMERKVEKMARFAAVTSQLYQELEVLAELESNLRRMNSSVGLSQLKLIEFQQKVIWQRQEVQSLREMSPWLRTYDYIVRLLLRSIFTIFERMKHVFGKNQSLPVEASHDSKSASDDCLVRSHSISSIMRSSVHPSEDNQSKLYLGPIGRSISNLGLSTGKRRLNNIMQTRNRSSILNGKSLDRKTRRLVHVGPFKGCMMSGHDPHVMKSCMSSYKYSSKSRSVFQKKIDKIKDTTSVTFSCENLLHSDSLPFNSKQKFLTAPLSTLGGAALALQYANVIIMIEKLASSPHSITIDARNGLYNMLPTSVRTSLSAKLKLFSKTLASTIFDASIAAEWNLTLEGILEWLAPLAHNMIRWHSERNFEKQRMVSDTTVLLIQTLYFADQEKTETEIIELLMALNYISRFGRQFTDIAFRKSSCSIYCDDYLTHKDNFASGALDYTSDVSHKPHLLN